MNKKEAGAVLALWKKYQVKDDIKKLKKFKVYVAPNYGEKVYEVEAVSELEAELEAIKLHDRGRWESCIVEEKESNNG